MAKKTADPKPLDVRGPFAKEGPLEWAILAEIAPAELTVCAFRLMNRHVVRSMWDLDEPRSWCVVPGTKKHHALVETAPGSSSTEIEIARALSKDAPRPVYALGFVGYDDPDHGLPFITRYDRGKSGLIWMADSGDLTTVPGPRSVPCDDPFAFAEALGCVLRPYFSRR